MVKQARYFIHAINIHSGGGRTLLYAVLKSLNIQCIVGVDERMILPSAFKQNISIDRVKPNLFHRIFSEIRLFKNVNVNDVVLCFGSLPPLFKLKGHSVVFVQNRYLIDNVSLSGLPLKIRFRLLIERLWLVSRLSNANEFVVQTPTMKKLMLMKVGEKIPIRVLPFVENPINFKRKVTKKNKSKNIVYDFIYVASGEAHKNHRVLIEAWILLAQEAIYPTLCLTLNKVNFFDLCKYVDDMRNQYDLKISNLGECSHCDILEFYEKSSAAIYPSIFESFGLPLIEARQAGLAVLAPELDYVRDIIDPDQVFDPSSSASIARAVKRFLGADEPPLPLLDASQFLASVFKKDI